MGKKLSELNAEVKGITFKETGKPDFRCLCIFMDCPDCGGSPKPGHSIMIPYSDEGGNLPDGRPIWKRVSGTTINDLTLSPSYHLRKQDGYCGLHGFVRNGEWT